MNNNVQILRYMRRQIVELDQVSAVEDERGSRSYVSLQMNLHSKEPLEGV